MVFEAWGFGISSIATAAKESAKTGRWNISNSQLKGGAKEIASIVADQFFPFSPAQLKAWKDDPNLLANTEPATYAEPDFYVWYHPEESFGSIFDNLTEHVMGKRSPDLSADGRPLGDTDPNLSPIGPYREYDANKGIYAIYDSSYFAGNAKKYNIEASTKNLLENELYPEDRAKEVRKKVNDANHTMDTTPGNWWAEISQKYFSTSYDPSSNEPIAISDKQLTTMPEVYSPRSTSESANTDLVKAGGVPDYLKTGELRAYFTLDWRQDWVKKATNILRPTTLTLDDLNSFRVNDKFFFNKTDIIANSSTDIGELSFSNRPNFSMKEIEKYIDDFLKDENFKSHAETSPRGIKGVSFDDISIGTFLSQMLNSDAPWLLRCAKVSANWRRYFTFNKEAEIPFDGTSKGVDGLLANWQYVDYLGAKYGIDPHIIRAVFMRRDNFGEFSKGVIDQGFGDFRGSDDPKTALNDFCRVYKEYADKFYNIPSLVLLAVNMRMTERGLKYTQHEGAELSDKVFDTLSAAAWDIKKNRFSKESTLKIAETLNRFPDIGAAIDQYFSAYTLFSIV
jgi:hypothetical protein